MLHHRVGRAARNSRARNRACPLGALLLGLCLAVPAARAQDPADAARAQDPADAARAQDKADAARAQDKADAARAQDKADAARAQDKADAARAQDKADAARALDKADAAREQDKADAARARDKADAVRASSREETFFARNHRGELVAANDAAGFGRLRQWAFSSDAALSFQRQTTTNIRGGSAIPPVNSLQFAPAADYFIIENLSVGGVVGMTYFKADAGPSFRVTLGPRVGYNFEVSRLLSVWPRLGFSYAHTKSNNGQLPVMPGTTNGTLATNTNANAMAISIFVPIMFHPAPHFFAGFGPFTDTDLSGHNRSNVWGFKLTTGGWVDSGGAQ